MGLIGADSRILENEGPLGLDTSSVPLTGHMMTVDVRVVRVGSSLLEVNARGRKGTPESEFGLIRCTEKQS